MVKPAGRTWKGIRWTKDDSRWSCLSDKRRQKNEDKKSNRNPQIHFRSVVRNKPGVVSRREYQTTKGSATDWIVPWWIAYQTVVPAQRTYRRRKQKTITAVATGSGKAMVALKRRWIHYSESGIPSRQRLSRHDRKQAVQRRKLATNRGSIIVFYCSGFFYPP